MSKYFLLLFISFCFSQNFSLEFDGVDDWAAIDNNGSMNLTGSVFSIQLWYKSSNVSSPDGSTIFDHYTQPSFGQANFWSLYINGSNSPNTSGHVTFSTRSQYGDSGIASNIRIDDNNWHHICVERYADGLISLFVDGVLQDQMYLDLDANIDNGARYGIGSGHHYRYTNCLISEVIISKNNQYFIVKLI